MEGASCRRCVSLDGDADRLVYFDFSVTTKSFRLFDGDKIAILFAIFTKKLLTDAGLSEQLRFGMVQTAYANGASTR